MTELRPNNITFNESNTTPIKVALIGLTMIQQSLLEFYFATQEGAQQYTEVLGKDADAFITNFDEHGAIEAWENLYAQENKPTVILSNCHKTVKNYLYFPRPITPSILLDAANAVHHLLEKKPIDHAQKTQEATAHHLLDRPQDNDLFFSDELSSIDTLLADKTPDELTTFTQTLAEPKNSERLTSPQETSSPKPADDFSVIDDLMTDTDLHDVTAFEELITLSESINDDKTETTAKKKTENLIAFEPIDTNNLDSESTVKKAASKPSTSAPMNTTDRSNTVETTTLRDETTPITLEPNDISFQQTQHATNTEDKKVELTLADKNAVLDPPINEKHELSFEASLLHNTSSRPSKKENKLNTDDDKITSPDELQSFLDELKEQDLEQKEKVQTKTTKKGKEQRRWAELCGKYGNSYYEKENNKNTRFNPAETLLPYLSDTIDFTQRASCWMELSYQPLAILIDPDNNVVYSSLSLEDPLLVQICGRKIVEELVEYLEVDTTFIEQIKTGKLKNKLFKYDINYFKWTVSLLISHGRLPEDYDLDKRISITNWLSLNKVEKFPYIMQIAAVFNQHHASLNEAATWMTLPKRYVYAFYNGISALDMIDKTPETSNNKKLITMGGHKNNNMLKNLLFKKII
jgi:hypothetical protein